ncbi:MAG: hypothetical protein MnENMB40S_13320 [Rhizobiaceae bacterium MnEN-MB40S]|nr:MAG: hypothetical protein MnENMB40S_13320 [Rhizobiaceae bacterium MnEN-MB40S]
MAIEDDIERAIFIDPDEWGAAIVYTLAGGGSTTMTGIFDREALQVALGGAVDLSDAGPQVIVAEADLPIGHANDDTLTIDGVDWVRKTAEPDGTGFVMLFLETA